MKKIIPFLMALLAAFALAGCSGQTFNESVYEYVAEGIDSFSIDVTDREIEISVSDDNKIHINCFESEKEYYEVKNENGRLIFSYAESKQWTDYIGVKTSARYRKISVRLPSGTIRNLSVSTTNERIFVNNLSVGGMALSSNGGDIILNGAEAPTIALTAKNGDISGTVIGGWDEFSITCKIKKGDCNLPLNKGGGSKSLTADCNNGDINISFLNI